MSDKALITALRLRVNGTCRDDSLVNHSLRHFECPHCGRQWRINPANRDHRKAAGFVKAAAYRHTAICGSATVEERAALMRVDEARWRRNPPLYEIWNNPKHKGFQLHTEGKG